MPKLRLVVLLSLAFLLAVSGAGVRRARDAWADEGWVIRSYNVDYKVNQDSTIDVVEDIQADFGSLQKHGIFRYIAQESKYDDKYNQKITIDIAGVDDGQKAWPYERSVDGINVVLKIGDPNHTISGPQRYRIRYRISGQVREFEDHNEFYWNVTGAQGWPVTISQVNTSVSTLGLTSVACYQGPVGSTDPCRAQTQASTALLSTTKPMPEGSGLTIVIGMTKGVMKVPPPTLVRVKSDAEKVRDFVGIKPVPMALAAIPGGWL